MTWTGEEIARAVGAAAPAPACTARAVCTDTRALAADCLYVALRGPTHDGHAFAAAALAGGAVAVLVDHVPEGVEPARAIVVADTLRALGDLAAWTRRRWGGRVVAITGSNGKTTTKEMLAAVFEQAWPGRVLKTHGNENNLIGVPLTLVRLTGDEAAAVIEMGMNAFGEIARLTEIAVPDVGVITNVGPAHLEGVGSVDGVARAKGELFAGMPAAGAIAVNMDDARVAAAAARFAGRRRIEFGSGRLVRAEAIDDADLAGCAFTLCIGDARAPVRLRAAGRHNVQNALAAAAAAHALGLDAAVIAAGLAAAEPPRMRMQVVPLANGVTVINDAYNANPGSTAAALDAVGRLPGRAIAALGEMRELGPRSAELHAAVGAHAVAAGVAWVLAVGPGAEPIAEGARRAGGALVDVCADAAAAAALIGARWQPGDTVLVKGSRGGDAEPGVRRYGARMAEVVALLEAAAGGRGAAGAS
ncbi:UDP-N-acetylmuramoyl-tripeptide--D-alanyl-D-alanine ligase [bacterium]|nr:UDP-N-acetylmuramoyl-tripeptide--D-alanyl-D-alanine ligase [bacterium]